MKDRKKVALSQLTSVQVVFRYGLAAFGMMNDEENWKRLIEARFQPNGHDFDWSPLYALINDQDLRKDVFEDFYKSLCRTTIRESLEIVQSYCDDTSQSQKNSVFRTEPWIEYVRTIRNCVAHDYRIRFKSKFVIELLKKGPLEYETETGLRFTISEQMDGEEIPLRYVDVPFVQSMGSRLQEFLELTLE